MPPETEKAPWDTEPIPASDMPPWEIEASPKAEETPPWETETPSIDEGLSKIRGQEEYRELPLSLKYPNRMAEQLKKMAEEQDFSNERPLKEFEKRMHDPDKFLPLPEGKVETHRMAWDEFGGKFIAFPTIVETDGKLEKLSPIDAKQYALRNDEYLSFNTQKEAEDYAAGSWKVGTPWENKRETGPYNFTTEQPEATKTTIPEIISDEDRPYVEAATKRGMSQEEAVEDIADKKAVYPDITLREYDKLLGGERIEQQRAIPPAMKAEFKTETPAVSSTLVPSPKPDTGPELRAREPVIKPQQYIGIPGDVGEPGVFKPGVLESFALQFIPGLDAKTRQAKLEAEQTHPTAATIGGLAAQLPVFAALGPMGNALVPAKIASKYPAFAELLGQAAAGAVYGTGKEALNTAQGEPITLETGKRIAEEAGFFAALGAGLILAKPFIKDIFTKVKTGNELTSEETGALESAALDILDQAKKASKPVEAEKAPWESGGTTAEEQLDDVLKPLEALRKEREIENPDYVAETLPEAPKTEAPEPVSEAPAPVREAATEKPQAVTEEPKPTPEPEHTPAIEPPETVPEIVKPSEVVVQRQSTAAKKKRLEAEARFKQAQELGYDRRTGGGRMNRLEISTKEEATAMNKVADDIEKAYKDMDTADPKELGRAVKAYEDSKFGNKMDDVEIANQKDAISEFLNRNGYSRFGTPKRVKVSKSHDEWQNEIYENQRIRAEKKRTKASETKKPDLEDITDEEWTKYVESLKLGKGGYRFMKPAAGAKVDGPAISTEPLAVPRVTTQVLEDYFGTSEVPNLKVGIEGKRFNGEDWSTDYWAEIKRNMDGSAEVRLSPDMPKESLRNTLVHEIGGHFGMRKIIMSEKSIFDALNREFQSDKTFFSTNKPSELRNRLFKQHGKDYKDSKEWKAYKDQVEPIYTYIDKSEDRMFDEWVSRQMETYDRRHFTQKNVKVVNLIKAAFKKIMQKLGFEAEDMRPDRIDRIIRDALNESRGRGIVEGLPEEAIAEMRPPAIVKTGPPAIVKTGPPATVETAEVPAKPGKSRLTEEERISNNEHDTSSVIGKVWSQLKLAREQIAGTPEFTNAKRSINKLGANLERLSQMTQNVQNRLLEMVPDKSVREAIPVWIEARGNANLLRKWANESKPEFKQKYVDAMKMSQKESPTGGVYLPSENSKLAQMIKMVYDRYLAEGQKLGIIDNAVANYVNRLIDLTSDIGGTPSLGTGTLMKKFRASNKRKFPTVFDAEQAGYKTMSTDIADLLPLYIGEFEKVVATKQFLKDLTTLNAKDGRVLAVVSGSGKVIKDPKTGEVSAYIVKPRAIKKDYYDYEGVNHYALSGWKWAQKTEDGKSIWMEGDLVLHPEIHKYVERMLGRSWIRDWYNSEGSVVMSIPKAILRRLDMEQAVVKQVMFSISGFHWVQEGTHGIWHQVNPFKVKPIDLVNNPEHMDAALHALKLKGDKIASSNFREAAAGGSMLKNIPGVGKFLKVISDPLFEFYIPALKFQTYKHILSRNMERYSKEIAKDRAYVDNVKYLSAQQTNAAYGHLNYWDLGRRPTTQHLMRMFLIAPDFLEARLRFAGQGAKVLLGGKAGVEQFRALFVNAFSLYTIARIANWKISGDPHYEEPFEIVVGDRKYGLRSVVGDMISFYKHPHQFAYGRVSPVIGKGFSEFVTRLTSGKFRDYRGQPITGYQLIREIATSALPISFRGIVPGTSRNKDVNILENFMAAMGAEIRRYSKENELFSKIDEWKEENGKQKRGEYPLSKYRDIRNALQDNDSARVRKEWENLMMSDQSPGAYGRLRDGLQKSLSHNPLGSEEDYNEFRKSLSEEDRKLLDETKKERLRLWQKFAGTSGLMNEENRNSKIKSETTIGRTSRRMRKILE